MPEARDDTVNAWTTQDVRHLLGRVSFRIDDAQVTRLSQLSCADAVTLLLREAQTAPLPDAPTWVATPWINTERRYRDTTPDQFRQMHGMTNGRYFREIADLRGWWIREMLGTKSSLREIMVLFWHGHFTSSIGKVLVSQAMYQQNATQRRLALGNFGELLREMTLDPAMLIYLDLEDSDRRRPNENYAREVFELFALGHGNYSQQDIAEAARALSGWRLDAPPGTAKSSRETDPETNRRFTRDGLVPMLAADAQDSGDKTIFGQTGNWGVEDVIELTSRHPACGPFLAKKLIDYFSAHDPQNRLRDRMAAAFRASGGDISELLRVLFTSSEFYTPESRVSHIKSPIALLVGACTQLDADVEYTPGLNKITAVMGQELFNPPNVKGWPGDTTWIGAGTLALRYHLADVILDSQEPPGLEPIGRGRGRPVPLPKDPAQRQAALKSMMGPPLEGATMEGEDAPRRHSSGGPPIKIRFTPSKLFPTGIPDSAEEAVDSLLSRLLSYPPRGELRSAALSVAISLTGEARVRAIVRLVLTSPDYQLT